MPIRVTPSMKEIIIKRLRIKGLPTSEDEISDVLNGDPTKIAAVLDNDPGLLARIETINNLKPPKKDKDKDRDYSIGAIELTPPNEPTPEWVNKAVASSKLVLLTTATAGSAAKYGLVIKTPEGNVLFREVTTDQAQSLFVIDNVQPNNLRAALDYLVSTNTTDQPVEIRLPAIHALFAQREGGLNGLNVMNEISEFNHENMANGLVRPLNAQVKIHIPTVAEFDEMFKRTPENFDLRMRFLTDLQEFANKQVAGFYSPAELKALSALEIDNAIITRNFGAAPVPHPGEESGAKEENAAAAQFGFEEKEGAGQEGQPHSHLRTTSFVEEKEGDGERERTTETEGEGSEEAEPGAAGPSQTSSPTA
ncbi:MAG: hypothetical protein M1561_05850 [Gammaproteobacteria bacterium]|nr:hypothetical protein [Gammaproteobacteria bacterium]